MIAVAMVPGKSAGVPEFSLSKNRKIEAGILEKSDKKGDKYLVIISLGLVSDKDVADRIAADSEYDMDRYESSDDDALDRDGYITAKRAAIKALYLEAANEFIEALELDRNDILDVSGYGGSIIMYASPETILRCAQSDYSAHIYPFVDSVQGTGEELP